MTTRDLSDPSALLRTRVPATPIVLVVAILMMLAGMVPSADANPRGYVETTVTEGLFYADFDREVLLFSGGTAVDFCNGDEPTHDARLFERQDGTIEIMVDASEQPIYLYSTPLGAPELVDATCAVLSDGDPDTVPLEPFAEGRGLVRMRIEISPDEQVHVVNSTVGTATSSDGTTWKVRGWADLLVVDGVPVGSPTEFQGLRIARTGS